MLQCYIATCLSPCFLLHAGPLHVSTITHDWHFHRLESAIQSVSSIHCIAWLWSLHHRSHVGRSCSRSPTRKFNSIKTQPHGHHSPESPRSQVFQQGTASSPRSACAVCLGRYPYKIHIWHLPPGSVATVRDVAEAHHTILIQPSQWPGLVVRLWGCNCFAVDTCNYFGLCSASRLFGFLADAGMDLIHTASIGPMCKWADDHFFICILCKHRDCYNQLCIRCKATIACNGGQLQTGSRYWFKGEQTSTGIIEEFNDDNSLPICDLSLSFPWSTHECEFTYSLTVVDNFT